MSDGLTVPFALAAGISGAIASSRIVVTAGIAEVAAGAIAMALGGYLAARTDQEHYASELERERREVQDIPDAERREVRDILRGYGLSGDVLEGAVKEIASDRERWVQFMMRLELGLEEPDPKRALVSGLTIGGSYVAGGLVPLTPYMLIHEAHEALLWSIGFTFAALFVFGFVKGRFTGRGPLGAALETTLVGGLAAAAAFGLARLFS